MLGFILLWLFIPIGGGQAGARGVQVLVSKAVAGDQRALTELLLAHHDRLRACIERKIPTAFQSQIDADDLLQQTYLEVFRRIGGFENRPGASISAWMETIAEHRVIDAARKLRTKRRGGDRQQVAPQAASGASSAGDLFDRVAARMPTPSANIARGEGVAAVQIHLAGLPDDYRRVIELRHLHGLSREETAAAMNRTVDEVRGLLYRALRALREAMGNSSLYLSKK